MSSDAERSLDPLRAWSSIAARVLPGFSTIVYDRDLLVIHAEGDSLPSDNQDPARVNGRTLPEVLPPETWERISQDLMAALDGESRSFEIEATDTRPSRLAQVTPLIADGQVLGGMLSSQDRDRKLEADRDLREVTQSFETVFTRAPIGMALVSIDGTFVRVNPSFCQLTGYGEDELGNKAIQDLIHPEDMDDDLKQANRLFLGEIDSYSKRKRYISKSGDLIWTLLAASVVRDRDGVPVHLIAQLQDISELRRLEHELRRMAGEDELTRLANRRSLVASIEDQIERARRYGENSVLLAIDLDYFKSVNDRFGHSVGDQLLRFIADELRRRFRSTDTVARPGGDEFAVLVVGAEKDSGEEIARELMNHLDGCRFDPEGRSLPCRASIGWAPVTVDTGSADEVLARADRAMYEVKSHRRSRP